MLKVEQISSVRIHTDEWRQNRLGRFTSSMMYTLMGDKPFTQGALTYIYERVGEENTGKPAQSEVVTPATDWGLLHEADALRKFGEYKGVEFLVTQVLINGINKRFSCTPDAILPIQKYGDAYEVETVEAKCYPSYGHYIECALCNTPQELKQVDKKLFTQCIDQMDNCDALRGYGILYHPDFRAGGFKVIPFRKMDLIPEFTLLKQRKALAEIRFDEIRNKLINLKNAEPVLK